MPYNNEKKMNIKRLKYIGLTTIQEPRMEDLWHMTKFTHTGCQFHSEDGKTGTPPIENASAQPIPLCDFSPPSI